MNLDNMNDSDYGTETQNEHTLARVNKIALPRVPHYSEIAGGIR